MGNIITRQNAEALIPTEYSNEIIKSVNQESAALSLMKRLRLMRQKQKIRKHPKVKHLKEIRMRSSRN